MNNQDDLRDRLKKYCGDTGRGAIKEIAARMKTSRQIISGFRSGASLSPSTAKRLNIVLGELTSGPIDAEHSPAHQIAEELEQLAKALRSPAFSDDFKIERLLKRVAELDAAKESLRRAASEFTKRSGKA